MKQSPDHSLIKKSVLDKEIYPEHEAPASIIRKCLDKHAIPRLNEIVAYSPANEQGTHHENPRSK